MHSGTIQYIMPNSGTYQFLAGTESKERGN